MTRYQEGDVPGTGRYRCTRCGWVVLLDDETDELPECRGKCEPQTRTEYVQTSEE